MKTRLVVAAMASAWLLLALACTRPTPGYCGGDGGAANCKAGTTCNPMTLLCELRADAGTDRPDAADAADAADARDAHGDTTGDTTDGRDADDVSKGCKRNDDCTGADGGPACVVDAGVCVTCIQNSDCKTTAAPACTADHRCVECVANGDCKTTALPACATDNHCVECVESTDCPPTASICQANHCVQCLDNGDCKDPTKPICQAQQCRSCMADSECPADPGVCMSQIDGHCATPGETIVVQMNASCVATAGGPNPNIGTAAMPACSMQPLAQLVTANRRLVVVRGTVQASSGMLPTTGGGKVSIVGQNNAVIAGGASPGLQLSGADAYVRSVAFKSSTLAGIRASASMLLFDGVLVDNNTGGGIFLDTSQFTIVNSTITNNGPGLEGAITWGGILINSLPPSGPKLLQRVTVQNNKATGIACSTSVAGTGVLASGNMALDVQPGCGFTSCGAAGPTCGAP